MPSGVIPHGTWSGYGYHGCRCDPCRAAGSAHTRAWRQANPERALQTARNVERKWRQANPAKSREIQRNKRRADPERIRKRDRAWKKTPTGRLNNRLNAQRRRGAIADDHAATWARIVVNDPCSYCGSPATGIDHIVPLIAGGTGHWDNLTAACNPCNASKHARSLLRHLAIAI